MLHGKIHATPNIHPATREILPEDPMEMQGFEVPGDPDLMLRLLVEEYARIGWGADAILQLARDPNYLAFHGFLEFLDEEELARRVRETVAQCGIIRVQQTETAARNENLVQIQMPD